MQLPKPLLIYCIVVLLSTYSAYAQNISGVVNTYFPISAVNITTSTLTLSSTAGITIGDTLLIIQMKGAQINTSNNSNYGTIDTYGGAGNFELVEICDIQGSNVILKSHLEKVYTASGAQLVSIPQFQNVTVSGTLTCGAWDGSSGGVLVVKSYNDITLNADIDVSERGFRGGTHFYSSSSCTFATDYQGYEYDFSSGLGGVKGEGIAEYTSMNCGRGALANGGGGGNDHNSGGAGGSNVSKGGNGGDNDDPGTFRCKGYRPGVGGVALDYSEGRIFLGGGGGGGHSNSAPNPYDGGDGGGIVILIADQLIGNGYQIISNGGNGGDGIGDGGAGGGAGGTLFLDVNSYSGTISFVATGGNGGNGDGATSVTSVNTDRCFGPGGGGSGGFVWIKGAYPAGGSNMVLGGTSGVVSGTTQTACLGLTQGAENGDVGVVISNNELVFGRKINNYCSTNPVLDIGNDTILCTGESVTYTSNIIGTYDWSTGSTTMNITVSNTGTYLLIVDDGTYLYCDSAEVQIETPPIFDLGNTIYLCGFVAQTISAPSGYSSYLWNTGASTESIVVSSEGEFGVTIGGANCSSSDSVIVLNEAFVNPFATDKEEICNYEGVQLDAGYSGGTYLWNTGETTQTIVVKEPQDITLTITSINGCVNDASVSVISCTSIGIPNTITPNGDGVNDTWIIRDIYSYPFNSVKIYDRSGRLVFETESYDNDWNGSDLPATVYYYSLILGPDFPPLSGTITIIRE